MRKISYMKKIVYLTIVMSFIGMSNVTHSQVLVQDNVIIDLSYGAPTIVQRLVKSVISDSSVNGNIAVANFGPLTFRGEYMVSDEFGFGIDVSVNRTAADWNRQEVYYNNATNQDVIVTYNDRVVTQKIGIMATFNYHFLENDNFDLAGVLGIGYGQRTVSYTSTQPNFVNKDYSFGIIWPIAARLGMNMRYFFTPNIGANIGLGIGQGGLINGGVSFKF
jgi:hypothetical protein